MNKNTMSTNGKKRIARNVLIGVAVAIIIAVAIFLIVALQPDGAGMNCFQRKATAASADGVSINFAEYRAVFDPIASMYKQYGIELEGEGLENLQDYAARQALLQKIYIKEAKALGIELTDEQKKECADSAEAQINEIEQSYAQSLIDSGNYSKAALESYLVDYYKNRGMNKDEYRAYLRESAESTKYQDALTAYYEANGSGIAEDDLLAFYRKSVDDSMKIKNEDGTEEPTYHDGDFWSYLNSYKEGSSTPMLYVPEGFIYIDFIKLEAASVEEAQEIINKVNSGETKFDDLMNSEQNKDAFRSVLKAPYPIAENDHSQLFEQQEVYEQAAALEVGKIGTFIVMPKADEETKEDDAAEAEASEPEATEGETTESSENDGETKPEDAEATEEKAEPIVVYLFRRANGDMCYDGDHGIIKLDYFDKMRATVEEQFRLDKWFKDFNCDEKTIHAYKGALQ